MDWMVFRDGSGDRAILLDSESRAFEYAQDRADVSGRVWSVLGPGYDDGPVPVPPSSWSREGGSGSW